MIAKSSKNNFKVLEVNTTHTIITDGDISQITGMAILILRSTMLFASRIEMWSCTQIHRKIKTKREFNWKKVGFTLP
jgi:hypothetical protein